MNKIILSTDVLNAVLQYLGNQKYVEVASLINAIQKEAKFFENKDDLVEENKEQS